MYTIAHARVCRHIDLAASSADTVAASLRSSPEAGSLGSSESMAVVDLLQAG